MASVMWWQNKYQALSRSICLRRVMPQRISALLLVALCSISSSVMAIQNTATGNSNGIALDASQATVTLTRNAASLIVVNTNDNGAGSLRVAMTNATAGQTITFDPLVFDPASPQRIDLLVALPTMNTANVTIDASNAGVIINGNNAAFDCITITSNSNVIKGLRIENCINDAIVINSGTNNVIGGDNTLGSGPSREGNVLVSNGGDGIHVNSSTNFIFGNYIGTDTVSTASLGNGNKGVLFNVGATGNTVGSTTAGRNNTIAGNTDAGISIQGANGNIITNNFIGTDAAGSLLIPNSVGINISANAQNNFIGGTNPGEGNVIAGNSSHGINHVDGLNNSVFGNFIGTNSATASLANGGDGILASSGSLNIGNAAETQANVIGPNTGVGIHINGASVTLDGVIEHNDDIRIVTGNLDLGSATLNLAGNWNKTGATVIAGTSTVVMTGIGQSIFGSTTFTNFSKSVLATDTLTFEAGSTQTFTGTLNLNGSTGQLLDLRSNASPALWNIVLTASASKNISYITVVDSSAASADAGQLPLSPTNSVDLGNTFAWFSTAIVPIDLLVSHVVDNATPNEGDNITFTITLTNNGPATANTVSIDIVLPAGLLLSGTTPSQGSYTAPSWNVGAINVGASATLAVQAIVGVNTAGTLITNTLSNLTLDQIDNNVTADDISESITIANDSIAPDSISNLGVSGKTDTSIDLTWTAPGDNTNQGTASSYDIRYATTPIDSVTWASATPANGEPIPAVAGSSESFLVTGLNANTNYYIAIVASDEVPNVGGLSNVLIEKTQGNAVSSAIAEVSPTFLISGSTANSFSYFILPTVNSVNGDTGVNQITLTAPIEISNISVASVSIQGQAALSNNCPASVNQYCASIVGNVVSVDIGSRAVDNQRIQIDLSADAPSNAGNYNFSASVDDSSTTTVAAQTVIDGDADGNNNNANSQQVIVEGQAASSIIAEINPGIVSISQTVNFTLDILPTIDVTAGDTGIDRLQVTMPNSFGVPVISDVLVGGVAVAYTNNSTASQIELDLTAAVTSSEIIQILFDAGAANTAGTFPTSVLVDNINTLSIAPQQAVAGDANNTTGDNDTLNIQVETYTDTSTSSVSVNPQMVIADGISSSSISITLRDNNADPKPNRTVSIGSSRQAMITTETVVQPVGVTDANGTTTGSISSTTPGISTIYVTDVQDNVMLAQQPQIFFTQGNVLELDIRANKKQVSVGDIVTYFIDVRNHGSSDVVDVNINSLLPNNFKYVNGSASKDNVRTTDPVRRARNTRFALGVVPAFVDNNGNGVADPGEAGYSQLRYQLVVGSGAHPGQYDNRVQAVDVCELCYISTEVVATVRVDLDPLFDLGSIIGKVFMDSNKNSHQDKDEAGIGGVMVVLDNGSFALTDEFGRYHFPAVLPGQRAIKVNLQTFSDISEVTTEPVKVLSVTPGLLSKANFGVAYDYDTESIGQPEQPGVILQGEQVNKAISAKGNVTSLSLLINGRLAEINSGDIKLGTTSFDDVVRIEQGRLKKPIYFYPQTSSKDPVSSWRLTIFDSKNEPIKTIGGTDEVPQRIEWNGRTDNGSLISATDIYHYQLFLVFIDGTQSTSTRRNFGVNQSTAISIELPSDSFKAGTSTLNTQAIAILRSAASTLREYIQETVVIAGHTDSSGSAELNKKLSIQRAQAAADYLIQTEKLPAKRFIVKGYGSEQPIATNRTAAGRTLNRRIEIQGVESAVDLTKLQKQYRTRPSVRIGGSYIAIDPYGRFKQDIEDPNDNQLHVEMTSAMGRKIETQIELPNFKLLSPTEAIVLPIINHDDNGELNGTAEAVQAIKDNKETFAYRITAKTSPKNKVLLDGEAWDITEHGIVSTILNLKSGENNFSIVVSNTLGFNRLIKLKLTVKGTDENGKPVIAVEKIPDLSVQLPPKGKKLSSDELVIIGRTKIENRVTVNGNNVELTPDANFAHTQKLAKGDNKIIIQVTDPQGLSGTIERDVEVTDNQLFLLAFADGKFGRLRSKGKVDVATMGHTNGYYHEGRIAYYLRGTIQGKYLIRSAYDSNKNGSDPLFNNIGGGKTNHLLQNIDPDKLYPVYGDASTLTHDAQSQGKFFLAVESDELNAMMGNYNVHLSDTELAKYQRTLHGVRIKYETLSHTRYGQADFKVVVFGADVRQIHIKDEINATGGSLYYLSHRNIIEGSEQVTLIVRDKDTNLNLSSLSQIQNVDYTIKYDQGRIVFNRPIASVEASTDLINQELLAGHPVIIQLDYETEVDAFEKSAGGAYIRKQIEERIAIGATYIKDDMSSGSYQLQGIDSEVRLGKRSRIVAEVAQSNGVGSSTFISGDGGLTFNETTPSGPQQGKAWKAAVEIDMQDWWQENMDLNMSLYIKQLEPGFSSNGLQDLGTRKAGLHARFKPRGSDVFTLNFANQSLTDNNATTPTSGTKESNTLDLQWKHQVSNWDITTQYQSTQSTTVADINEQLDSSAVELAWHASSSLTTTVKHQETLRGLENRQTTLGADYKISNDVDFNVRLTDATRGTSRQATLGMNIGKGRVYLTERVMEDKSNNSSATILGTESPIGENSKVYSEYQRENVGNDGRYVSLAGVQNNWKLSKNWTLRLFNEYSNIDSDLNNSGRYTTAVGLSYANGSTIKMTTRNEYRKEWGDKSIIQYASTNSVQLKLDPDYTLLGELRSSRTFDRNNGSNIASFDKASLGLAYRPIAHDELNALARITTLTEQAPVTVDNLDVESSQTDVVSIEWSWELNKYLEWVDKEAMRIKHQSVNNNPLISRSILSIHRLNIHIWRSLDWGLEYREFRQLLANDKRQGWLTELAWKFHRHIRLGAGYNFTDFSDNEFADNDYSFKGSFIRLQATY